MTCFCGHLDDDHQDGDPDGYRFCRLCGCDSFDWDGENDA